MSKTSFEIADLRSFPSRDENTKRCGTASVSVMNLQMICKFVWINLEILIIFKSLMSVKSVYDLA